MNRTWICQTSCHLSYDIINIFFLCYCRFHSLHFSLSAYSPWSTKKHWYIAFLHAYVMSLPRWRRLRNRRPALIGWWDSWFPHPESHPGSCAATVAISFHGSVVWWQIFAQETVPAAMRRWATELFFQYHLCLQVHHWEMGHCLNVILHLEVWQSWKPFMLISTLTNGDSKIGDSALEVLKCLSVQGQIIKCQQGLQQMINQETLDPFEGIFRMSRWVI